MIAESLYANDIKKLQKAISEYMDKSISFYDAGAEGFYHGLTLGLIALLDNQYRIKSNRESGDGRYDISLIPREKKYPGIIMELKWKSGLEEDELEKLSEEALCQIDEKRYVIFDNVGSKLAAIEDVEERHRVVMDIVYNLEVFAEERSKELLAPLELEM